MNIHFLYLFLYVENILGEGGDSIKILTPLLAGLRLSTGPNCIAILHDLIRRFADYSIRTQHGNQYICEIDTVKDKLAKVSKIPVFKNCSNLSHSVA